MAPNSSTSSSEFSRRWLLGWLGLVVVVWAGYFLLAPDLARWLGTRFGDRILALGEGRILDPVAFARFRGREAAILLTALVVGGQLAWQARHLVTPWVGARWRWLPLSLIWFAVLNLCLKVAASTGLWWLLLYSAHPNLQLTAFEIERILMEESGAPTRLVVLGSSQGQSEIATGQLNGYGRGEVRAANLSFAGADAADFILMREHYRRIDPQVLVIYLSPINIYGGVSGTRWTPLLTPRSLAYFEHTEIFSLGEGPRLLQGIVGLALPMVQQRVALQHALFGLISEQGYRRPPDPDAQASSSRRGDPLPLEEANDYSADPRPAAFQQHVLEDFLLEEATTGRRVVVIDGTVHPALMAAFPAEVRAGYAALMQRIGRIHENVIVLREDLPRHSATDYADLYHVRPEVRTANTRILAQVLATRLGLTLNPDRP